jgi:octaprenyl-diphosphate synthase
MCVSPASVPRAAALAVEALADLPESAYKHALRELADFAVDRSY